MRNGAMHLFLISFKPNQFPINDKTIILWEVFLEQ